MDHYFFKSTGQVTKLNTNLHQHESVFLRTKGREYAIVRFSPENQESLLYTCSLNNRIICTLAHYHPPVGKGIF